jgi:hypothetical protein
MEKIFVQNVKEKDAAYAKTVATLFVGCAMAAVRCVSVNLHGSLYNPEIFIVNKYRSYFKPIGGIPESV